MANKKEHEKDSYKATLSYVSAELAAARRVQDQDHDKYKEYYKMLHCERISDLTDIESDIFLPEFVSRVLTIIGEFVAKYFQSRDFVETRTVQSDDPKDILEAKATKKLLNTLLSDERLFYFQKIVRLLMFVIVYGYGIVKGSYVQSTKQQKSGTRQVENYLYDEEDNMLDENGMTYLGEEGQNPMKEITEEDVYEDKVIEDYPNFDVYPVEDVYFSQEYAYSLRDKLWVIFRSYYSPDQLRADQEVCGYIESALRELEALDRDSNKSDEKPKTSKFIQDYVHEDEEAVDHPIRTYKVYERYGKAWVSYNKEGLAEPGIDKDGRRKADAVLEECIISWVATGDGDNPEILIRFQVSPYPVRPMVRFNCYIDLHKDTGFGDGEPVRELTIAANDTFNVSNFRTMLATTPSFKAKKYQNIPSKIKVSPQHVTFLENVDDLVELEIKDNIQGALAQIGLIRQEINEVMAASSLDTGAPPENRETATMGSILAQKSAQRSGLRTASLEFAGFVEFYSMLLALINTFMLPETLIDILGEELAYAYNPKRKDKFFPVSQALETEDSKQFKVKMLDQLLGRVVAMPNPKTPMVVNYIIGQILETIGGDFKHFKRFMFDEDPVSVALYQIATGKGGGSLAAPPTANMGGPQTQNQQGLPVRSPEQAVRENQ